MTRFEYLAIFYGIVVGLSLENVAASFHRLFEARGRVRWHWMAPTNAVGSAIAAFGQFWLWWLTRDTAAAGGVTILSILPGALASILLYLVCAATLPDEVPAAGIDLKEFYFSSSRQFWALVAAVTALRAAMNIWDLVRTNFAPEHVHADMPFLVLTLAVTALAISLIYIRAYWWHAAGIVLITATTVFFFGLMKV